jgi:hypothetical protein
MDHEDSESVNRVTIADVGMSCGTCFYRIVDSNGESGCHRNPPDATRFGSYWPLVLLTTVCGEWKTDQQPPPELGLAELVD